MILNYQFISINDGNESLNKKKKGRSGNQPFLNQPKPKLNQKPNHLCGKNH